MKAYQKILLGLALAAQPMIALPVQAQLVSNGSPAWYAQVDGFLTAQARELWGGELRESHERASGKLQDGSFSEFTYPLRAGVEYSFLGVCDVDCSDLDLELLDAWGNSIDSDFLPDDYPIVRVRPRQSGTYTLRVHMADCQAIFCYWNAGVFQNVRGAGSAQNGSTRWNLDHSGGLVYHDE